MNILASKFRQRQIETELMQKVAQIVLEVGAEAPRPITSQLPLDPCRLRGVPIVGHRGAIGGAMRGTRPGDSSVVRGEDNRCSRNNPCRAPRPQ